MQHQTISWLLVMALVLQLVFQIQFHLHHGDELAGNGHHVIDYHHVIDGHSVDHPPPEATHEFKATPDVILKKNITPESIYIPAIFLFLLVAAIQVSVVVQYVPPRGKLYRYLYYGIAPPTRAPPAI